MDSVKRRQNACAWCFVTVCLMTFVFQLLKYVRILPSDFGWSAFVVGACVVTAYVLLYTLSSNVASEIFAVGQIGIGFYFWLVVPILQMIVDHDNLDEYRSTYYVCIAFSVLAIYFWCVLLNSNGFTADEMRWMVFLPMTHMLNVCDYWCLTGASIGIGPLIPGWLIDNIYFLPIRWSLQPAMVIGFWKLSHSAWYSGGNSGVGFPSFSPFNKYFAAYAVAIAAILIIF